MKLLVSFFFFLVAACGNGVKSEGTRVTIYIQAWYALPPAEWLQKKLCVSLLELVGPETWPFQKHLAQAWGRKVYLGLRRKISGTPGKDTRSLMLHNSPALPTWENTASQTEQIPSCPQAPGSHLLILLILWAILGCWKVKIPGCRQLLPPHFAGMCTCV